MQMLVWIRFELGSLGWCSHRDAVDRAAEEFQESPMSVVVRDCYTDGAVTVTREIVHRLLRFDQIGADKFRQR